MDVSFVIPANKTPKNLLDRCLRSIDAFVDKSGISHEKIVITDRVAQSVARERGVESAKGRWIWFVDADDEVVHKNEICEAINISDADIVAFGHQQRWGRFGKRMSYSPPEGANGLITSANLIKVYSYVTFRALWNKLFKRAFLQEYAIRFRNDTEPCEDAIFIIDCLKFKPRWTSLDVCGYIYWRRLSSSLFRYCSTLEYGLRQENLAWESLSSVYGLDSVERCKWTEQQIARLKAGNELIGGWHLRDNGLVHHFMTEVRRYLRFIGI